MFGSPKQAQLEAAVAVRRSEQVLQSCLKYLEKPWTEGCYGMVIPRVYVQKLAIGVCKNLTIDA